MFLVVNILLSWLSLPYLGILQVICLFLYYKSIVPPLPCCDPSCEA